MKTLFAVKAPELKQAYKWFIVDCIRCGWPYGSRWCNCRLGVFQIREL